MSIRPRGAVVATGAVEAHHHADLYVTHHEYQQFLRTLETRFEAANRAFDALDERHTKYATTAYTAIETLYNENAALLRLLETWVEQQIEFNFQLTKQVCALRAFANWEACPPEWVYRREALLDQPMRDAGSSSDDPTRTAPSSSKPYIPTSEEHKAKIELYTSMHQAVKGEVDNSQRAFQVARAALLETHGGAKRRVQIKV